jgi:iron complex transport system substrate-binding protein
MADAMTTPARIVSFLPSATEMACALGLGNQVVGITHECDYPPEVLGKSVVVSNALPIETMSQPEIDAAVAQRMRDGLSLYQVDEKHPDLFAWQGPDTAFERIDLSLAESGVASA